jgi:enoyl-CoA hydratase
MGTYENLRLEVQDRVAIVTLDRPPVNALSTDLYRDIACVFSEINSRAEEISVAVLTSQEERAAASRAGLSAVYHCAVPLISAVNGPAMGAGFAFALLSDFIISSETAVFAFPEIDANVNPSLAMLLRGFNQFQARALAFTGERVSPAALQDLHVVRSVVASDRLMAETLQLARVMSAKSPPALRSAKWSANEVELMLSDFEAAHRAVESPVSAAMQIAVRTQPAVPINGRG